MIKCYLEDKTLLVQFTTTELDHHVATYIKENVDDIIMRKNIKNIIFDFQNIKFMDSSGIGVLLNRYKEMKASRGSVCYCRASRRVRRLMELSGICRLMEGYESREQAVGALK